MEGDSSSLPSPSLAPRAFTNHISVFLGAALGLGWLIVTSLIMLGREDQVIAKPQLVCV